ncbi:M20 family metallopeptidase [Marinobacterium sp. BA1]|uniref:M20 family metallopeptidase n=1 Tax=Marinobacterium sp. BA1 TaxID=3138931 RepID=UPI0032E75AEA
MNGKHVFDTQQKAWFEAACKSINKERLRGLNADLVNIHSPTGAEQEASRFMATHFESIGLKARYQPVNESSGNAIGELCGDGTGPSLLLYAPIDTHLEGNESDLPMVGDRLRDDMKPEAILRDELVIGLGASNPKAMVASLTEAVNAVIDAGVELKGKVTLAFAGGGMPLYVPERNNYGMSTGVTYMLTHGVTADFGIIMKPWYEIYHEHPGMCWFKVSVKGSLGYAGIPRGTPGFRSSIIPATTVINEIEQWLADFPARHSSEQIAPEGWIASVRSGWPERPAFPAATTEIFIDVRTNPTQTMADVRHEFDLLMQGILSRHPDIEAEWDMYGSCPGSSTPSDHWIVQSARAAWEQQEGKPYPGAPMLSGQTDAAMINKLGIPLVRVGYPWIGDASVPDEFSDGLGGMGVSNIDDLVKPIENIIYSIIDCCTRTREETSVTK